MANSVKYLSYDGLKKFTSSIGQIFAAEIKGTTSTNSISIYPVAKYKEYTNGSLSAAYSEKVLTGVEIPLAGASTSTNAGLVTASEYTKLTNLDANHWHAINSITPGSPKASLTITGGTNVTVKTTPTSNEISFSSPDVSVSSTGDGNVVTAIDDNGHSITYTLGKTVYSISEVYNKTEIDGFMTSALEYSGTITAKETATNNLYGALTPSATRGNVYVVKGSGYINGIKVDEGDMFLCSATSVNKATSSNYSTIQGSWNVVNVNWNVVDNVAILSHDGAEHEIAKVGGHSIHVGVANLTTTGSVSNTQTPSHGGTFDIITGGSFNNDVLTFNTNTVTLPDETTLTVDSVDGDDITGSYGGSFDVVTSITGSGHTVTYTVQSVKLPDLTDTKNTAGRKDTSSKIFLVGVTSQPEKSTDPDYAQTFSHDTVFVDTNGILNSGLSNKCASTVAAHAGTMVITCNDSITNADIDELF